MWSWLLVSIDHVVTHLIYLYFLVRHLLFSGECLCIRYGSLHTCQPRHQLSQQCQELTVYCIQLTLLLLYRKHHIKHRNSLYTVSDWHSCSYIENIIINTGTNCILYPTDPLSLLPSCSYIANIILNTGTRCIHYCIQLTLVFLHRI